MNMGKFIITEEERNRIILLHKTRTSQLYLTEQITSIEQQTMIACGAGDLLKVKTLNGKNAQEVDNVVHTICDNLKNKFPYEYKVYSPNFENSRQAASSVKTQQTAKKTIEKNVSDKNYEKFKKFCDNTKLLSAFKSWADTNSAPLIKQLGITQKTTSCDVKYYQLWFAKLKTQYVSGEFKTYYLGEAFKHIYDFGQVKKEALGKPEITSKRSTTGGKERSLVLPSGKVAVISGDGSESVRLLGNSVEKGASIEVWIDYISLILEIIPGFGTLASGIIDIATSLVNLVKSSLTSDTFDKAILFTKGIVGLAGAFIPAAGNVVVIAVKKYLSVISDWWGTLLSELTSLVGKGKITKSLANKLLSDDLSTILGVIFNKLINYVSGVTKDFVENGLKAGLEGAINLLKENSSLPGLNALIEILETFLLPINGLVQFINSSEGQEIKNLPRDLSKA